MSGEGVKFMSYKNETIKDNRYENFIKTDFLKLSFNLPDLLLFHLPRANPKAVSCVAMDLQ